MRADEVTEARLRVLAEDMEREKLAARAEAVGRIKTINDIEKIWKPLDDARDLEREKLKNWIALNADDLDKDDRGNPILYDGELDITYVLISTRSHSYDLVSLAEQHPEAVVNAAKAGWLKADHQSIQRHPGASWVDRLKGVHDDAGGSQRLEKKNQR